MPRREDELFPPEIASETEDDAEDISRDHIRQAVVTSSDWTTETLLSQMKKRNIDLDPAFQRREVWSHKKKCSFVESIILNLPIPQLVLAERHEDPNAFLVIDGKQRLLAIRQFCADPEDPADDKFIPLKLDGLAVRDDLKKMSYRDLQSDPNMNSTLRAFENHTIRTVVIRHWANSDFLHMVFWRLNSGSVPLSSQELRQALIPGEFMEFLNQFASTSDALQSALGISKPDFRMRDNEILLRYLAFALKADDYPGNLKRFLDEFAAERDATWSQSAQETESEAKRCEEAIVATQAIFGEYDSFSTYSGESFEGRFNRAVFDIMTYYFRDAAVREAALQNAGQVKSAFKDRSSSDAAFQAALTTTTKSKPATATRFTVWARELSNATGIQVDPPPEFLRVLKQ